MKKIFTILILLTGLTFTSLAQSGTSSSGDPSTKIIKSYPNPATSVVNFDFQHGYDKSYSMQIFNFMGKKVAEIRSLNLHTDLPLTNFYRGIYFYKLSDRTNRIIESGRFQVVK